MKNPNYFFSPIKVPVLVVLGFSSILYLSSYKSKPPTGKTGASNEGTCMDCHSEASTTIDGLIELSGLTAPIIPGQTYDLTLNVKKSAGSPIYAGFEMIALNSADKKAGEFSITASSDPLNIQEASGRQYLRHSDPQNYDGTDNATWSFQWKAPDTGSVVNFYAAAVLANKANGNKDDKVVTFMQAFNMQIVATTQARIDDRVTIAPNPARDLFTITLADNPQNIQIGIYDMTDRLFTEQMIAPNEPINIFNLPNGLYTVKLKTGDIVASKLLMVRH